MLQVFLTRQALSSQPRQQMVWLYWLQAKLTSLRTHNETQWPTAAPQRHFSLRDLSRRQSCHLSTPSLPRVPPVWPYCWQVDCFILHDWDLDQLCSSATLCLEANPVGFTVLHLILFSFHPYLFLAFSDFLTLSLCLNFAQWQYQREKQTKFVKTFIRSFGIGCWIRWAGYVIILTIIVAGGL
jgi:hypothetical protein